MATIFPKKVENEKKTFWVVDNTYIHLHFKFHPNPVNGFGTRGFQRKTNCDLA